MISKVITLKLRDGSFLTKTVYGPNELILSKNINDLMNRYSAVGFGTQTTLYYQGR